MTTDLPRSSKIVIIVGGVMNSCSAYHFAGGSDGCPAAQT